MKPFTEEVQAVGSKITGVMLDFYERVLHALPATPSKFHYIFNLRDLSRVYEGLLMSTPDVVNTAPKLVRLWRNEVLRLFCDRLISNEDKNFVQEELLKKLIQGDKYSTLLEQTQYL